MNYRKWPADNDNINLGRIARKVSTIRVLSGSSKARFFREHFDFK